MRWFGQRMLPLLAERYPSLFTPHASTRPFLLTLRECLKKLEPPTDVRARAVGRLGCARLRIRPTSPTFNGTASKTGCRPAPSAVAQPRPTARSSTPSCICCVRVVLGGCCPLTLAAGAPSTAGSLAGAPMALGSACMTGCVTRSAGRWVKRRNPPLPSWTASRSSSGACADRARSGRS